MNRYDYDELKNKALGVDATEEDVNKLGEWFEQYGDEFWNGEYYKVDSDNRLYPQYREVDEDEFEVCGYVIK